TRVGRRTAGHSRRSRRPRRPECRRGRAAPVDSGSRPARRSGHVTVARVPDLSVVIPVRNEAAELPRTLAALRTAVDRSGFSAEIVLVDDGSTDGSADAARAAVDGLPLQVVRLPGSGRFEARRAGLEAASGELVLLLDSRVRLEPDALHFLYEHVESG